MDGEDFAFVVKSVCGFDYDETAGCQKLILVYCLTNPKLNHTKSAGTTWITAVDGGWHQKIIDGLARGAKLNLPPWAEELGIF